jgi:hypothetical protein
MASSFIWELGIDWDAVESEGVSYLRGGLVNSEGIGLPGTAAVQIGDTVTFKIFDITSSGVAKVAMIGSFGILSRAAVKAQLFCWGLSPLQPTMSLDSSPSKSTLFPNATLGSWTSQLVQVTAKQPGQTAEPVLGNTSLRFLLTTQIQAIGLDGVVRLFGHDPEMVVGGDGG